MPLLGNLSSLMELTSATNSFTGTIPTRRSNCKEFFQVDLSDNHMNGTILNKLIYVMKLNTLDLSENNLIGTIPRSLFNMLTLQTLNVAFKNLSRAIPIQLNNPTLINVNFTINPYLCIEGSCGTNSTIDEWTLKGDKKQGWIVIIGSSLLWHLCYLWCWFWIFKMQKWYMWTSLKWRWEPMDIDIIS